MEKKKRSPEEKANLFWRDFQEDYLENVLSSKISTPQFKNIPMLYLILLDQSSSPAPFKHLIDNITLYTHPEYFTSVNNVQQKNIKNVLNDFKIPDKEINKLELSLQILTVSRLWNPKKNPILSKTGDPEEEVCKQFKGRIKQLAPMLTQLEKMRDSTISCYESFSILIGLVAVLQCELDTCKAIVNLWEERNKEYKKSRPIAFHGEQIEYYWKSKYFPNAVEILKPFCIEKKHLSSKVSYALAHLPQFAPIFHRIRQ